MKKSLQAFEHENNSEEKCQTEIQGTVCSVIYENPENGYTVLRLDVPGEGQITAVGCIPFAAAGERLTLTGAFATHQYHGEQFRAERVERLMPSDAEAIFGYLASGIVKGIGPATARLIVDKFGDEALEVIENRPEELSKLRGMGIRRAKQIALDFRRQSGVRRLMEFLAPYGFPPLTALLLYKQYGHEALNAVRANPYILADEYYGANFLRADAMALSQGFAPDSPERAEAAVLFEMQHNLSNGHTFLPGDKLAEATARLLGAQQEAINYAIGTLTERGEVMREDIAGLNACYLRRLFRAEAYVAKRLLEMVSEPPVHMPEMNGLVEVIEREMGIEFASGQRRAVDAAAKCRVSVLTGGPGTGKTTAVRAIIALFDRMGLMTALTAPTGRAAKRMNEITGREATTVHRLLGVAVSDEAGEPVFTRNETDPLEADAVILDETSMADILLIEALLRAMKPDCRLVLVGDADQLPSVGPGNFFSDVIRSEAVDATMLTEIFRQAAESRIITNAHRINNGKSPELAENSGDFFFLSRKDPEKCLETIVELCSKRLPENMGIMPDQIQVLSPTKRRAAGTVNLNKFLQNAINPGGEGKNEKKIGEIVFREGDRVMQIRNNYDIMWRKSLNNTNGLNLPIPRAGYEMGAGVFNGDTGRIISVDTRAETLTVDFDDKLVEYSFEMLTELEPAYAVTVHKSQGSEYRAVILACADCPRPLEYRGLLYTAVTRARELLVIVGDSDTVMRMTENDKAQKRYSGLKTRLTSAALKR